MDRGRRSGAAWGTHGRHSRSDLLASPPNGCGSRAIASCFPPLLRCDMAVRQRQGTGPLPKRILFVINSLAGGGAERVMATLLRYSGGRRDRYAMSLALLDEEPSAYEIGRAHVCTPAT